MSKSKVTAKPSSKYKPFASFDICSVIAVALWEKQGHAFSIHQHLHVFFNHLFLLCKHLHSKAGKILILQVITQTKHGLQLSHYLDLNYTSANIWDILQAHNNCPRENILTPRKGIKTASHNVAAGN